MFSKSHTMYNTLCLASLTLCVTPLTVLPHPYLLAGVTRPMQRLPHCVALWAAEASLALTAPGSPHYVLVSRAVLQQVSLMQCCCSAWFAEVTSSCAPMLKCTPVAGILGMAASLSVSSHGWDLKPSSSAPPQVRSFPRGPLCDAASTTLTLLAR